MIAISPRTRTIAIGVVVGLLLIYALRPLFTWGLVIIQLAFGLALWIGIIWLIVHHVRNGKTPQAAQQLAPMTNVATTEAESIEPGLTIGTATGRFRSRNAANSPEKDAPVWMDLPTACRGIMTVGQQGSGKTSGVFFPYTVQAMDQGWSTLTFAIKSNVPGKLHFFHAADETDTSQFALIAPPGFIEGIPSDFPRSRLT